MSWAPTEAMTSFMSTPCLIMLRGVAALVASMAPARGFCQVVMAAGKLMRRKARPMRAGLKGFWPRPPKNSLATTMAMKAPRTAIQMGVEGGRTRARRRPVTTAEKSPMLRACFVTSLKSHSERTEAATQATTRRRAWAPKR